MNNIDSKYTWDLTHIYENYTEWEKDFEILKKYVGRVGGFKNKLNQKETFINFIQYDKELDSIFDKLYLYVSLSCDKDLSQNEPKKYKSLLINQIVKYYSDSSFITTELLDIDEKNVREWISSNEKIKHLTQWYDNFLKIKKYTLSNAEEHIMSLTTDSFSYATIYRTLTDVDIKFPMVKNEDGSGYIEANDTNTSSAMNSTNREYRKRIWTACYDTYAKYNNTIADIYIGHLKSVNFKVKARNYESAKNKALYSNNINEKVYDNLINTTNDNISTYYRWIQIKSDILGYKLKTYDLNAPLIPSIKKTVDYEKGKEIVLNSLSILGDEYVNNVNHAFNNRWIDVYPGDNKRSGAYSSGATTKLAHPYVLMNWTNNQSDVSTLSHEMGHNMHSLYSTKNQPDEYMSYPIFTAEVASTTNEIILFDYMMNRLSDSDDDLDEKLHLLEMRINDMCGTFFRQVNFSNFENNAHELVNNGEAVTSETLNSLYSKLEDQHFDITCMDKTEHSKITWSRIPHFYTEFYVYQYATGLAASQKLADNLRNTNNPSPIINFISSGGSSNAIETLQKAGVDMTDNDTIKSVINELERLMDEFEKLYELKKTKLELVTG